MTHIDGLISKAVDGAKLLHYIESNPEADGFWSGVKSLKSFDLLTDAINSGKFAIDLLPTDEDSITVENEIVEKCAEIGLYDDDQFTPPAFVDDLEGEDREQFWDWIQELLRGSARNALGMRDDLFPTDVDVTYLESTLSMMRYNLVNGTQEITNDEAVSLIDDIYVLRAKLAEEQERLKIQKEISDNRLSHGLEWMGKCKEKEAEVERLQKERELFICLLPSEVKIWETEIERLKARIADLEDAKGDYFDNDPIKGADGNDSVSG